MVVIVARKCFLGDNGVRSFDGTATSPSSAEFTTLYGPTPQPFDRFVVAVSEKFARVASSVRSPTRAAEKNGSRK